MNKRTHCLMYHPEIPVKHINPVLNVDQLVDSTNQDRSSDNKNLLSKLVRLNWMVENLKHEPVYKPLLTVLRNGELVTVTGDTRLQAIELNPQIIHVSCLASIPLSLDENFKYWDLVYDKKTLATYLGINVDDIIINQDWEYQELDWIEFALPETKGHLHDEDLRYRQIVNYLNENPDTVFSRKWLQTPIDWSFYS
jgi:hypothetical protein